MVAQLFTCMLENSSHHFQGEQHLAAENALLTLGHFGIGNSTDDVWALIVRNVPGKRFEELGFRIDLFFATIASVYIFSIIEYFGLPS